MSLVQSSNRVTLSFLLPCWILSDVLLMATGYAYDFFFLDPECGVKVDQGKVVSPLYEHVIHIERPTLAFIGLPWTVRPRVKRAECKFTPDSCPCIHKFFSNTGAAFSAF